MPDIYTRRYRIRADAKDVGSSYDFDCAKAMFAEAITKAQRVLLEETSWSYASGAMENTIASWAMTDG